MTHDTLDAHAFAAAHEAAPHVDPEDARRIVDAYMADLHITVNRIADGRALTSNEAEAAFAPSEARR